MVSTGETGMRAAVGDGVRGRGRGAGPWAAVLAMSLALPLAGCAKEGHADTPAPWGAAPSRASVASVAPTVSTPSSAATPAGDTVTQDGSQPTPSTTSSDSAGPVMVGRRVIARRADLSFEVPARWQAFDPARAMRAGSSALPKAAKDLAAQSGMTIDEYLQRVGSAMEVMVMGPLQGGSADNISVIPTPVAQLPTADDLKAQLESVGAQVGRVYRTSTPVGPAIVAESRLPVGSFRTNTRSVAIEHGGHVSFVTVTATTKAGAESLLRTVLATLRPA